MAYIAALMAGQCVERAAGLARIACHLGRTLFVAVEFLEHDHRQKNIMLFKTKQTHRIMQQHIGVEHKQLWRPTVLGLADPVGAGCQLPKRCAGAGQGCQGWFCCRGLGSVARQRGLCSGIAAIRIWPKLPKCRPLLNQVEPAAYAGDWRICVGCFRRSAGGKLIGLIAQQSCAFGWG